MRHYRPHSGLNSMTTLDATKLTKHWSSVIPNPSFQDEVLIKFASFPQFWQECIVGQWLFCYATYDPSVSKQQIVKAACACARLTLYALPDNEPRPRIAIEVAEAWTDGKATLEEVEVAADHANDAANWFREAAAAVDAAHGMWYYGFTDSILEQQTADIIRSIIPMPMTLYNQYLKYSKMKAFW
jgi:hypothetical protein